MFFSLELGKDGLANNGLFMFHIKHNGRQERRESNNCLRVFLSIQAAVSSAEQTCLIFYQYELQSNIAIYVSNLLSAE